MRVHVQTLLACPPEYVWREVGRSALLKQVCWPLVTFRGVDGSPLPERWASQETVRIHCRLFGVIPFGVRTIRFEEIDDTTRQIRTREHDRLIRRWDHLVSVEPHGHQTLYSDTVEIDAGWLTLLVWLYAQWLYRHRQRQWRRIARELAIAS